MEWFSKWSKKLGSIVTDDKRARHSVWMVPASFCAMRDIEKLLPGDENNMKNWS